MSATVADELLAAGSTTVAGAVAEFGISRSVLYELMQRGELIYTQLGARRLIPRIAMRRLLAAGIVGLEGAESAK